MPFGLDIGRILGQYSGINTQQAPQNVEQDFDQIAQHSPHEELANGLGEAFRSDQTPPFGNMVGQLFGQSNNVEQIDPNDVQQLAEHAQSQNPGVIDQLSRFYAQNPTLVKALGGAALAIALGKMAQRGR